MHNIQKILLKRLVLQNNQRYSELTKGYDFENNIVFHLKKLIENKFIQKNDNKYSITADGIKQIYNYELADLSFPGIKTFFCGFVVSVNNDIFLLKIHPTAKNNFYNLPSGRPRFGEEMHKELVRLLKNNIGLLIEYNRLKFLSLHAKIVKTENGEKLFDDGQAIFKLNISKEEKEKIILKEDLKWFSKDEIRKLKNCWPEIEKCILNNKTTVFESYEITSNYKL